MRISLTEEGFRVARRMSLTIFSDVVPLVLFLGHLYPF